MIFPQDSAIHLSNNRALKSKHVLVTFRPRKGHAFDCFLAGRTNRSRNVTVTHSLLYTAGPIVSHLQLLFVVVVVLTNHNKPRWLTCDPTWRACAEYITWCRSSGISNHKDNTDRINMAEGYANSSYNWPNMNWAAADLSKEWERFYQHCEFTFGGPPSKCTEKEKICNLMSFVGDKGQEISLHFDWQTVQVGTGDTAQNVSKKEIESPVNSKHT